jgi:pyrroloquinoline quinone biosynthesis protein B
MRQIPRIYFAIFFLLGCGTSHPEKKAETDPDSYRDKDAKSPFVLVLGTLQDGGSPHAGCTRKCCRDLYQNPDPQRKIISLGLVDPASNKTWLFEASPDLPTQLFELNTAAGRDTVHAPDGIFVSHAHIGHYGGLIYLGREAMNTKETIVYVMPRFRKFLESNGPWDQLLTLKNIVLESLENEHPVNLSSPITVKPLLVPHRDEYSETVGFLIQGPSKKILFIPDIDKWSKWNKRIEEEIRQVDVAFIDGTFYDGREINNRDISEIPHPFITESVDLFRSFDSAEKKKIHFIHFNHTNPLLDVNSRETKVLQEAGYNVAFKGQKIYL